MGDKRILVLALCLLAGPAPAPPAKGNEVLHNHTITAEDVLTIRELSEVKLSPDGKQVVFVVTEPNDTSKPKEPRTANIWIVPSDGSEVLRPVISGLKNVSSPRWSPDGQSLAFLSDEGEPNSTATDKSIQIYLMRNGEKKAVQLTSIQGGVEAFQWSPDSKMIAFTTHDLPTAEELARKAAGYDAIALSGREVKYSRLWTTNLSDRSTAQITKQNFEIHEMAWSPAGDEFALVVAPSSSNSQSGSLSLVIIGRSTGETVRILSKNVSDVSGALRWSPDGRWITFFEIPPTGDKANFWLSLAPAQSGPIRPLLKDYQGTILAAEWTRGSKSLFTQSIEGTKELISAIDINTGGVQKIVDVLQSQWGASFSSNGEAIAYLAQTTESGNDLWVIGRRMQPRRITDLNPQTKSWSFGKVSEVVWKNTKDALERRGVLITPPNYKPGTPFPMVVNAHPGDTAFWVGFHASKWWNWGQLLASNGYVVFMPNTRGVTGEGGAMHATNSNWGGMAVQDLLDGVDYLVAEKIADPNRLGIGGWSNGGFITEYTITRTTRFKAAVAQAGHSDFFSLYGASYLRDGLRVSSGASPFYDRKWYDEHSPITFIKNARTPTLLLHGEWDPGVPVSQAREFYTGLQDVGIETELVIYPREGHSIQEYSHRIDLQKRMLAWFDKYLK